MTTTIDRAQERMTLLAFLHAELAARPGRLRTVFRITASCVLVVVLAMTFQIPLPAYSAYIALVLCREEAAATLITGLGVAVAATFAVALSLLFYLLDAGEPALRIPLLALSTFIAMFFARTSTLGPIAFLAGFILVLSQTLIDDFPTTEFLTRFLLWLWLVVALPVFVTMLIDLLWGVNPAKLMRVRADDLLRETAAIVRGNGNADPVKLREDAIEAIALRDHAALWDRSLKSKTAVDLGLFEGLATFLSLLSTLPADSPVDARKPIADALEACRVALRFDSVPSLRACVVDEQVMSRLDATARPVVVALAHTVDELLQGATARLEDATDVAEHKRVFVADAFTNRGHVRFAVKVTLAVTLAYLIYTLLDWPGIRTAVTTCFFVSLGSMAETVHKLSLRLTGAIVGGTVAGFCIVYLLPHMTDIGQLGLLIAVMSALSGWVATSSERLAYAGMQMAFAFYLGILHDYAPATDLTVLRDRVVGIVLGNILMSMIFSALWPVSATQVVRASMGKVLELLAKLVSETKAENRPLRLAVAQELMRSHKLASLALFERGFLSYRARSGGRMTISHLDRIASAVFVVQSQGRVVADDADLAGLHQSAAHWLSETAALTRAGHPLLPPLEEWSSPSKSATTMRGAPSRWEAMNRLHMEIVDVASES